MATFIQLLCTCPSGAHRGILAVEAPTEKDALALVPPMFRTGTRADVGEIFIIGEHEAVPVV